MRRSRVLAAVVAAAGIAVPAAPAIADDDRDVGGKTTVVLNPGLVSTLVDTLKVAPIAPGTLTAPGGVAQVAFPITDIKRNVVSHSGGLSFHPVGGGRLAVTNFEVSLRTNLLTAKAKLNGKKLKGRVPLFRIGATRLISGAPACNGIPAGLTLTQQAATALGLPDAVGAFIGNACVAPVFEDDDDDDDDEDDDD